MLMCSEVSFREKRAIGIKNQLGTRRFFAEPDEVAKDFIAQNLRDWSK